MPLFQTTNPHDDTRPRRALTEQDTAFLTKLQSVLNTQDNMCTRPPLYWGIMQTQTRACGPGESEFEAVFDHLACTEYVTAAELLDSLGNELSSQSLPDTTDLEDLCEALNDTWPDRFELLYYKHTRELVRNAVFLTHAACEDHLRKYGYNYQPDAHAYAMHADRCPEFEQLLDILQSVNWTDVASTEQRS